MMEKPGAWTEIPDEYLGADENNNKYYLLNNNVYRVLNDGTTWLGTKAWWDKSKHLYLNQQSQGTSSL